MTIEDIRAKVARWQANLLDNAARAEEEAGRSAKPAADSIRQTARDMRHRAREIGKIYAIVRVHTTIRQMTAELEERRVMLLACAEQLPPEPAYGPRRRRLSIAAADCADALVLLRQVEPMTLRAELAGLAAERGRHAAS
jgi:hypothetical protein